MMMAEDYITASSVVAKQRSCDATGGMEMSMAAQRTVCGKIMVLIQISTMIIFTKFYVNTYHTKFGGALISVTFEP